MTQRGRDFDEFGSAKMASSWSSSFLSLYPSPRHPPPGSPLFLFDNASNCLKMKTGERTVGETTAVQFIVWDPRPRFGPPAIESPCLFDQPPQPPLTTFQARKPSIPTVTRLNRTL